MEEFLSEFSTCYFEWLPWKNQFKNRFAELVDQRLSDDPELVDFQDRMLSRTILSPIAFEFPPSVERTRRLIKPVVAELESKGVEVREEFYRALAASATDPSKARQFKSYFVGNGRHLLSLAERSESICEGTTGLTTWTAAKSLLRWLRGKPGLLQGNVLELGSGAGYTGIGLAKLNLIKGKLTLTDHHIAVLQALANNVDVNLKSCEGWSSSQGVGDRLFDKVYVSDSAVVGVEHLDWQLFDASAARELNVDVVIGADIIFDEEILPALVETVRLCLGIDADDENRRRRRAFIAGVVRNEKTSEAFVRICREQYLKVEIEGLDESPRVLLYKLSI